MCLINPIILHIMVVRERNIIEHVNKIAPRFQEGVKAFSGSPIVGEVHIYMSIFLSFTYFRGFFLVYTDTLCAPPHRYVVWD